jgi:phenylalanyl-tRNA synthetase alpha chain
MQALGSLPPEERKAYGQVVNSLKDSVDEALEAKRRELTKTALGQKLVVERADVTLPVREGPLAEGRIHPVSQVTDEITEIFADMGFSIAEGPDIETDFNNFTALNIPPEHPARQDHDTFYLPEAPDGTRVRVKVLETPDGPRVKPEYDDVAALAKRTGRPAHEVARDLRDRAFRLVGSDSAARYQTPNKES